MTERKLYEAAEQMSQPSGTFSAVRQSAAPAGKMIYRGHRIRFAALFAAVLLLVGCGATVATYGNYSGFNWSTFAMFFGLVDPENQLGLEPDYKDAQKAANKLNITIPEQFGSSQFDTFETVNSSTQTNWILSWFDYDYQRFWLTYGIESEVEEQLYDPDGTPGLTITAHRLDERIFLDFGSTEGELWRELFHFDENAVWHTDDLIPDTYSIIEYNGKNLQTGITSYTYDYHWYDHVYNEETQHWESKLISVEPRTYYSFIVTWVDEECGVVFKLSTDYGERYEDDLFSGVSEETLIEYAKQLIDLNS